MVRRHLGESVSLAIFERVQFVLVFYCQHLVACGVGQELVGVGVVPAGDGQLRILSAAPSEGQMEFVLLFKAGDGGEFGHDYRPNPRPGCGRVCWARNLWA